METLEYIKNKYCITSDKQVIQIDHMNREDLAGLFRELGYKTGAEIGTLRGDYALTLCENIPGLRLYCVDPYKEYKVHYFWHTQEELDEAYEIAQEKLSEFDVMFIKEKSVLASEKLHNNSLDFVYIDADHTFRHVVDDIDSWYQKVRKGGIIAGHDYLKRKKPTNTHVIEAVNAFADSYSIKPIFITDRPADLKGKNRDMARSWFIVKL